MMDMDMAVHIGKSTVADMAKPLNTLVYVLTTLKKTAASAGKEKVGLNKLSIAILILSFNYN